MTVSVMALLPFVTTWLFLAFQPIALLPMIVSVVLSGLLWSGVAVILIRLPVVVGGLCAYWYQALES